MKTILIMFVLVLLQNASFTLVSRARNSSSILYHGLASIGSNGFYLLVFRQLSLNLESNTVMLTYLVASVLGSIGMHYLAMQVFEKKKHSTFDIFLKRVESELPSTVGMVFSKNEINKINLALSKNYRFTHDEKVNWFKSNISNRIYNKI